MDTIATATIARWLDFRHMATLDPATGRATFTSIPFRVMLAATDLRDLEGVLPRVAAGTYDHVGGHLVASFDDRPGQAVVQIGPHPLVWIDGVVHRGEDVVARVAGPDGWLGLTLRELTVEVRGTTVLRTRYVPGRTLARMLGRDEWGTGGDDYDCGLQLARWYAPRRELG